MDVHGKNAAMELFVFIRVNLCASVAKLFFNYVPCRLR